MRNNTLLREIKEVEGAFDAGFKIDINNFFSFYSFRDPHSLSTYFNFEKAVHFILNT
jgi:Zn-dependent M16 (insulinase) family peptidase